MHWQEQVSRSSNGMDIVVANAGIYSAGRLTRLMT